MKHHVWRRAAALAAAVLLWAQSPAAPVANQPAVPAKAENCIACHGPAGVSTNPHVPSLAGQPKQFISTQLVMFRERRTDDPVMSSIAASLSNAEINEVATYFSSQALPPPNRVLDETTSAAGKRLTEQYRCVQCHTPALRGQQHIPRLAGQQRDYLLAQLHGFRAGTRFDMDGNMTSAVQGLSEADAAILADYLSALR